MGFLYSQGQGVGQDFVEDGTVVNIDRDNFPARPGDSGLDHPVRNTGDLPFQFGDALECRVYGLPWVRR